MNHSRGLAILATCLLVASACSGSGADDAATSTSAVEAVDTNPPATDPTPTDPPATEPVVTDPPATDPPATDPATTDTPDVVTVEGLATPQEIVELLASDEFNGRDNQTPESIEVQEILVSDLAQLSDPAFPDDSYLQPYELGTNIVGIIPGSGDLADEYVMVGAHYDHLAPGECDTLDEPDDVICNGAADNAAGVAAVLTIAAAYATTDARVEGERSMIVAFWDGEEDGLVGAHAYAASPAIPLEQVVAYVNFDIQGVSLLPSLANSTVLVGPETGGQELIDAATAATSASPLDYATFSLVFGQGRSDHAVFAANEVPSVFFTDANNGCYHTVLDDPAHVDFAKLDLQISAAKALTFDLLYTSTPPSFVTDTPLSTFSDAEQMLALVHRGGADLGLLPDGGVAASEFIEQLDTIVGAGPDAYDDAAGGVVLGGAAQLIDDLANSECLAP